MPWYLALSGSVLIILAGTYKKYNIGLIMVLAAAVLGLLSGLPAAGYLETLQAGILNEITIMLILGIILIGILGHVLKGTGAMKDIIDQLHQMVANSCLIAAALPMLIGMLAVPGGAVMSAPLCEATGKRLQMSPVRLAAVNNWFRHVLYFTFPLFPSLIVASGLSGVSLGLIFIHNLPLTIAGTIGGYYLLFRGFPCRAVDHNSDLNMPAASVSNGDSPADQTGGRKPFLLIWSLAPILLALALVLLFNLYFPLALSAGLVLALLYGLPSRGRAEVIAGRLRTMILPGVNLTVAFVIVGIMLYKEMLSQTGVIASLASEVLELGLPVLALVMGVSFMVGLLTGDNTASIAILVPLLLPLISREGAAVSACVAFLYACSTAGHIISPAHPCFALTKEYFGVEAKTFVGLTLPLLALVLTVSLVLTLLLGSC